MKEENVLLFSYEVIQRLIKISNEDKIRFYKEILEELCNGSFHLHKDVARSVVNWHRAIQANMFRFCLEVLKAIAGQEYYDGRNKRAVLLAREMLEAIGINTDPKKEG